MFGFDLGDECAGRLGHLLFLFYFTIYHPIANGL